MLLDDRGESIKEAGPSTPVEILGLTGVPAAIVRLAESLGSEPDQVVREWCREAVWREVTASRERDAAVPVVRRGAPP